MRHLAQQMFAIIAVTGGVFCLLGILADAFERIERRINQRRLRVHVAPKRDDRNWQRLFREDCERSLRS